MDAPPNALYWLVWLDSLLDIGSGGEVECEGEILQDPDGHAGFGGELAGAPD